jgi:methylmalonyl-CoA/ethylmalonyl-CoA epimerase
MLAALNCTFHHIGIACRNLDKEQEIWANLGYTQEGDEFEDSIQQVRGRFLVGVGPRLEILVPASEHSPLEGWLKRNIKMYHQAFTTPRFDIALESIEKIGARRIEEPAPAIAFGHRRIVFVMASNGNLIELIEEEKGD